jgi:peptidyl-prolyl cis-trans isomerase A (cyclophilin A)
MKRLLAGSVAVAICLAVIVGSGSADEGDAAPSPLLNPKSEAMTQKAPDVCKIKFETTAGDFVLELKRDWAPKGVDRFFSLVENGFYNDCALFRIEAGFVAQWGINGDPEVAGTWLEARIADDPVKRSNTRGFISFATAGPNTRTTQVFINYRDNGRLDSMGFAPFGKVVEGMDVVDKFYAGYGGNKCPDQGRLQREGNPFLAEKHPELDYIKLAYVMKDEGKDEK